MFDSEFLACYKIIVLIMVHKLVTISKYPGKPLGLTVEQDKNGNIVIARVLSGSVIEQAGILKHGDIIVEVNGKLVVSPEDLTSEMKSEDNAIQFRIVPGCGVIDVPSKVNQSYMRALFDYNPKEDSLLPCKEIGLLFKCGDILQMLDQKDPIWWEAKKLEDGCVGLIPSLDLEERRKSYVPPEADYVHKIGMCGTRIAKKKRKKIYQSKWNIEFDKAEVLLYEEVVKMPPFKRRTLALVGPYGVGRRTLKGRLINSDPEKFGGVIPHTSRPIREYEDNGKNYWFLDREDMEEQIRNHKFLEYGEHNGNLYGTSLDSVRNVINEGKMCVLDCSPPALKTLHNSSEFMPYVIFIAAPGMEILKNLYDYGKYNGQSTHTLTFDRQSSIRFSSRRAKTLDSLASLYEEDDFKRTLEESACLQRTYEKYIDMVIINEDFDQTFLKVVETLDTLANQHQWVPVNWVY